MMVLKRKVAGLILAAILVVAVQLVPNLAFAHAGHEHHAPAMTAPTSSVQPPADHATHSIAAPAEMKAAPDLASATAPSGACVGGCCGPGMGCCGSVLIVSEQAFPPLDTGAHLVAPVFFERPGIASGGLKRPPRILT